MSYAYIGRKPCGCVVAAFTDAPEWHETLIKVIVAWLRAGWTVEHRRAEYVRLHIQSCHCEEQAETARLM